MFAVAPFWFFSLLMMFPDSPVWVVFSIFPFSAPVIDMLRLGMTGVPGWQLVASMTRDGLCHRGRVAADRQAAAVLPADVRQEAEPAGNCPQPADRLGQTVAPSITIVSPQVPRHIDGDAGLLPSGYPYRGPMY